MNKELFDSIQKQMTPSPEVRAALDEKLAQPVKKRPTAWKKYGALAACAALVIGAFSIHSFCQDSVQWMFFVRSFQRDPMEIPLHSYVTVEDLTEIVPENTSVISGGEGGNDTGALPVPNTGDLPGGAYIGDVPTQEEAVAAYERLMAHFNGDYPGWYGGAYISGNTLMVRIVDSEDPGDKSLELQVLDWAGGRTSPVGFTGAKYSLSHLNHLMVRLNELPETDPKCGDVMASWCIRETENRIELTLTQVYDPILAILAELDPEDDAIYVQVGQRASVDGIVSEPFIIGEEVTTDSAKTEDPAVHHAMPGGATDPDVPVPEDDDLIAFEPYYDGTHYGVEDLPQELPAEKQPAFAVDSVPEENSSTDSYSPSA